MQMRSPFGWLKTEYANPGAENYAFVPNMTLPPHAYFGRGTPVVQNLALLGPPPLFTEVTVPTVGYGGLVAGQFIALPLSQG